MSALQSEVDLPPPIMEPKPVDLTVTIHSIEGLNFLTELGSNQLAVSILFPTFSTDSMSPTVMPNSAVDNKYNFDFTETYNFQFYPVTTINALLANPLEMYLYICTADMKKQTQVARFVFPFDQLFFNDSYSTSIEGKILPEGAATISSDGIFKANIECTWSAPIFDDKTFQEDSIIATFNIQSINSPPLAMVNCSTQPNNCSTHIFTYSLSCEMPDGQTLTIDNGKFQSTTADGSDSFVSFNSIQKFFIRPNEEMEKWKESAESDEFIQFYLKPELSPLLQPLGITSEQFAALFGVAKVPLSHFAKPGRSHFQISVPLERDKEWSEHNISTMPMSPNGFPAEIIPEGQLKGKKGANKLKTQASARTVASKTPTTSKKPKALSAKDKKMLTQLQNVLSFDEETDYFKESTTSLKLEITLSKPIIPRPATPASSKTPQEIVQPLPKMHEQRLADATEEFSRQIKIAIDKLQELGNETLMKRDGDDFQTLKNMIKESLKPSIVQIVRQVFLSNEDSKEQPAITPSFVSELRSFLLMNLNRTLSTQFDLAFPHAPPIPPEMGVDDITRRIESQNYHKTDDLEKLHQKRCELDPLNPRYPFEFALYYNDINSPKAMEWFAKAISIDYNFSTAILGFCSQLAKSGNRGDCIVLLKMLDSQKPDDPTITVCLSILYQLIESSRTDEYMTKVSRMSETLSTSPNLIAANSLLESHDTYLSEIMLSREQRQGQSSQQLLVALAKFTQYNGEFSRSQEYLREALDMDSEDLELWKMLGVYQFAANELDKAMVSLEKMLTLAEVPDPEVCLYLALIEILNKNYSKAYDLLMFTVQNKEIALAWTALGVCCMRMGDFDEAESCFCQANEIDKWDATTWGYCAVLCAILDRYVEGEQAVILATKQNLRDYRLIQEIIKNYDEVATGEETKICLNNLKGIQEKDCHKSLESENAEVAHEAYLNHEEEEEEGEINEEEQM